MSKAPTNKVAAAGAGGAASVVLIYLADLIGLDLPEYVAMAIVTIAAFAAGYLKKENK